MKTVCGSVRSGATTDLSLHGFTLRRTLNSGLPVAVVGYKHAMMACSDFTLKRPKLRTCHSKKISSARSLCICSCPRYIYSIPPTSTLPPPSVGCLLRGPWGMYSSALLRKLGQAILTSNSSGVIVKQSIRVGVRYANAPLDVLSCIERMLLQ